MPNPFVKFNGQYYSKAEGPLFSDGFTWLDRARRQLAYIGRTAWNLLLILGVSLVAIPIIIVACALSLVATILFGVVGTAVQVGRLITRILSLPVLAIGGALGRVFKGSLFAKKKAKAEAASAEPVESAA